MSDEEKEALEILKSFEPDDLFECAIYLQALERITNLIEKQSKEIEELKAEKDKYYYEWKHLEANMINKIKAKIEEEDKLFFKTKDVRHANRYKAYKELLEKGVNK